MDSKEYHITVELSYYAKAAAARALKHEAHRKWKLARSITGDVDPDRAGRCTQAAAQLQAFASALAGAPIGVKCASCEQHLPEAAFSEQERVCNSCARFNAIEDAEIRLRNAEQWEVGDD